MLHKRRKRKFSRDVAHRVSMLRNLSKSLIRHKRIATTLQKAKSLRPVIEKLITLGRVGTLHARRRLIARLGGDYTEVGQLINDIAVRFKNRKGGYTRIIKSLPRKGDCASMAYIEFVFHQQQSTVK